jgi:threonyl-tRNA synthetase
MAFLIEKYAGAFPVWLAPVQVILLPIADRHLEASQRLYNALQEAGIRTELNTKAETLQAKIRTATLQKIPFMGIIGDKEAQGGDLLSVRTREGNDLGALEISQFITKVKEDIDKKV